MKNEICKKLKDYPNDVLWLSFTTTAVMKLIICKILESVAEKNANTNFVELFVKTGRYLRLTGTVNVFQDSLYYTRILLKPYYEQE